MAELIVTTPDSKETVDIGSVPFLIGRQSENDLNYADTQLSRRHCVIKREGPQFFIEDLDSKNGTYVNGKDIKRTVLNDGDQIEIGDVLIRFRQDPSERERLESFSESSAGKQTDRIVSWINSFQTTRDTSSGEYGSLYAGTMILGILVLLLYGGYLLLLPVQPYEGVENMLSTTGAWSGAPDGWNLSGASFGPADGHEHVLKLNLSPDRNRSFARYQHRIPVDPSTNYVLNARVSTRKLSGLSGARITWIGPGGNETSRELVLPLKKSNQRWVRLTSPPLHPPEGATHMELSFFSAGTEGTVLVHDPVLQGTTSDSGKSRESPRIQASFDEFPLRLDSSGQLTSPETDGGLLLQSGLRFRTNGSISSGWTTTIMNRSSSSSTLHLTGTAFTPKTFQPVYFTMKVTKRNQPRISYQLPASVLEQVDEIGFRFRYRGTDPLPALRVLTSDGLVKTKPDQPREKAFGIQLPLADGSIILQFSRPLTVQYRKTSGTSRWNIDAFASADAFNATEKARETNRVNVGITLLKRQPENEQKKAVRPSPPPGEIDKLIRSSSYEEALTALNKLQPYHRFRKQGPAYQRLHEELQHKIQRDRSEIQQTIESARNLNSPRLLRIAEEQIQRLRQKLGSHSDEFQLKALEAKRSSTEEHLSENKNEPLARELYNRFRMFKNADRTELAREFARELVDRTENETHREEARSFLEQ